MLTHDEAISLFLDVAGSCSTEIELNELFKTESDEFTLIVPGALKVDWCEQIITQVKEDSLYDRSCQAQNAIRAILAQDLYSLTRSESTSCLRSSTLCQMMDKMLATHKPCCVAVRLPLAAMSALTLHPCATMSATTYVAPQQPVKPSAPTPEPVTPSVTLLIVECETQCSLSPPGPASDKGEPHDSPLPVDRAYGLQVAPPSLQVPVAPPVLHPRHAPVLASPAPDPWPHGCRLRQTVPPSHPFCRCLAPFGRWSSLHHPPDVDCCRIIPAPDLHCRPRGCDDASAPRAHPTSSTTDTPIPPAAPPHKNGAPATLGDPPLSQHRYC
jgi:hypothetical protein